jgi:hypothetical protein
MPQTSLFPFETTVYAQGSSFLSGQIHFLFDLQRINSPLVSSKHTLGAPYVLSWLWNT